MSIFLFFSFLNNFCFGLQPTSLPTTSATATPIGTTTAEHDREWTELPRIYGTLQVTIFTKVYH
jgi:hypothetical protein